MDFDKFISTLTLTSILILAAVTSPVLLSSNFGQQVFAETINEEMIEDKKYNVLSSDLQFSNEELTISTIVIPDFEKGSSEMTIASQDRAFALGIDTTKDVPKAVFAIFDGYSWHYLYSYSEISEELTHIAATFGDSTIDIYVNGEHEGTLPNIQTLSINERGVPEDIPLESLTSYTDVIVGAFVQEQRGKETISKEFGGFIQSVDVFESKYDETEINSLYLSSFTTQTSSDAVETQLDEIVEGENTNIVETFNEEVDLVASSLTGTSNNSLDDSEQSGSILDGILENFKRIAEKFSNWG